MGNGTKRIALISIGAVAIFLSLTPAAFADVAFTWGYIGSGTSWFASFYTMGVSFLLIVAIEALVFRKMLKFGMVRALLISLLLNVYSTVLGFVFGMATFGVFHDLIGLPLMIGFIIWWIMKSRGVPPWITVTVYVTTIVGWFMALSSSLANLIGMGLGVIVASAILPLLLGFGLSIAFEGVLARGLIKRDNLWAAVFRANALSYILLAVIISVHAVNDPSLMTGGRASFPSRAKGTLHAIGSTQLAYQGENKARVYGSFQAMKDTLYIAEGYTLGSMIENYSMSWQVNNISTVSTEKFPSGIISTFTVIAWPSDRRRGFLSTFGVTDDQIVRVYTPQNGNRLEDVKTWDPIL